MAAIALSIWLHQSGGCVLPPAAHVPPPRTVPVLTVPEKWRPREVVPPKKKDR